MNDCEHDEMELRFRPQANQYVRQCLTCGWCGPALKHEAIDEPERRNAPEVDDMIRERWWKAKSQARMEVNLKQRRKWFDVHGEYTRSHAWKEKRGKVLRRDGYVCQACLNNEAHQVHHLSYKHWGNEPLFELVSVCKPCHDKITDMDRNGNPGPAW